MVKLRNSSCAFLEIALIRVLLLFSFFLPSLVSAVVVAGSPPPALPVSLARLIPDRDKGQREIILLGCAE